MTLKFQLEDLDLAALISSRICHDIISPVGAIVNGLEVLDEEDDDNVRAYAMDLIRRSADQASAKLQFARLAFGAGGSAGSEIALSTVQEIAGAVLDEEKHSLVWNCSVSSLAKDRVKLLLNLIAISLGTLPRGGQVDILVAGSKDAPILEITSKGTGARIPERVAETFSDTITNPLDTMSIQPYYAMRLSKICHMSLKISEQGGAIVISAKS